MCRGRVWCHRPGESGSGGAEGVQGVCQLTPSVCTRSVLQVTDGTTVLAVDNGVAMLPRITATGCSVTALIAGFVAAGGVSPLHATAAALAVFG